MEKKMFNRDEEKMRQRIQQLRNQLDELSGGTAMFGPLPAEEVPLEMTIQFLEHVLCFERVPDTTWKQLLAEVGYTMPAPELLSEEETSSEVWMALHALANLQCTPEFTNHLSDRELYQTLYDRLEEPTEDMRMMGDDIVCHLEMLLAGDEADDLIWLKYYADESTRQRWHGEFGISLPPKADPPYDRDRHLPLKVRKHSDG